jgi:hypothetical protein
MKYFNGFRAVYKGPIIGLLSFLFLTLVLLFPLKQVWPQNIAEGVEPFLRLEKLSARHSFGAKQFEVPNTFSSTRFDG